MDFETLEELFNQFLPTTTSEQVRDILHALGDHADIGLQKEFSPMKLFWQPYGNKESNYSSIGLASKPGRSLTERITNAIDAVIEDRSFQAAHKPESPQAAVNEWFGRPVSTSENGLFNWDYREGNYDKKVGVVLTNSGNKEAPTVDVIDIGCGIKPEDFPKTILSLQEGNKIKKRFVVGSFGQGGASTIAWCDFVLIISRASNSPDTVGFTLIRELKLGDDYKDDCYAYLAVKNSKGEISVPSFQHKGKVAPYKNERVRINDLTKGTLVRHYSFRLTNLHGSIGPGEGNLYHFLHCSLFDPLLPFQIIDIRNPDKKPNQQIVKGSRNRLMSLVSKKAEFDSSDEVSDNSKTELKLYRPICFIKPHGAQTACVKVEYWVAFNSRKKQNADGTEQLDLRSESNTLFVQKRHFTILTLNGQNQGELTIKDLIKDLGLDSVAKHMVIHVDATGAPSTVKKQLFTTNRESVKDEAVLESIKQEIRRLLDEDESLKALENELIEKEINQVTEKTDDEVKKQINKLLREAGFTPSATGDVLREGNGKDPGPGLPIIKPDRPYIPPRPPLPIPTLLYPEVSRFEIVSPKPKMLIRLNDSAAVKVETDADSRYNDQIRIKIDPQALDVSTFVPLSGGRLKWRLRASPEAVIGNTGKISVTLTKPDGDQLKDDIEFEVIPPVEKPSKTEKGFIPDFEVVPVTPGDGKWDKRWPTIDENSSDVGAVAYKPEKHGLKTYVFYSTVFHPFSSAIDKMKNDQGLRTLFETNYKVWIGYHAILQLNNDDELTETEADEAKVEAVEEHERNRVAQMQVKQAFEMAKLMMNLQKQKIATD